MNIQAPIHLQRLGCKSPKFVSKHNALFPCGHCLVCRSRRGRQWAHRLAMESTDWRKVSHITLTYAEPHHLDPLFDHTRNFHYEDFQLFMKRFRKHLDSLGFGKVKFFIAGERGENGTQRVHWHLLLFGCGKEMADVIQAKWRYGRICHKEIINKSGMKKVAAYVSQYVLKKVGSKNDSVSHCSQGIGLRACMRLFRDTLLEHYQKYGDFKPIVWLGETIRLDRYLKTKIADSLGILEELKSRWKDKMNDFMEEIFQTYENFFNVERPTLTPLPDECVSLDTYPAFPRLTSKHFGRYTEIEKPHFATYRTEFEEFADFANKAWDFLHKNKYELYEKMVELRIQKNNRGFHSKITKKSV